VTYYLDLIHRDKDEWCVALNGRELVSFSGPGSRVSAQRCAVALQQLIHAKNTQTHDRSGVHA